MTRRLALVRHSISEPDDAVPPSQWRLSAEGLVRAGDAVDLLRHLSASRIFTSYEPKAYGTATVIAQHLGLPVQTAPGTHEHERPRMPFYEAGAWHRLIQRFFANPDELVFGLETADHARERFKRATTSLSRQYEGEDLILVTHGTVLSLYLAEVLQEDPYSIWQGLKMPDVRVVALNG